MLMHSRNNPGAGNGLGLSISYDMVNKHDGEIRVDIKEGEFVERPSGRYNISGWHRRPAWMESLSLRSPVV